MTATDPNQAIALPGRQNPQAMPVGSDGCGYNVRFFSAIRAGHSHDSCCGSGGMWPRPYCFSSPRSCQQDVGRSVPTPATVGMKARETDSCKALTRHPAGHCTVLAVLMSYARWASSSNVHRSPQNEGSRPPGSSMKWRDNM